VDETFRVRVSERVGYFACDVERFTDRQWTFCLDLLLERWPFDVRHDVIRKAVYFTGVEHWKNVRMLKAGRDVNLSRETLAAYDAREIGSQNLESDPVFMAEVARQVYDRHASTAKLTLDLIPIVNDSSELVWRVGQELSGWWLLDRQL
jgi:hypothetical protein